MAEQPARAVLAQKVEALHQARARFAELEAAASAAETRHLAALRARDAAEAGLAAARENAASHLANTLTGHAGPAPVSVKDARAVLEDACDELEALKQARERITSELRPLRDNQPLRAGWVAEAAAAVLGTEGGAAALKLAREVEKLQRELADKGAALEFLQSKGARTGNVETDNEIRLASARWRNPPLIWDIVQKPAHPLPTLAKWSAVLTALQTDATAAVPRA